MSTPTNEQIEAMNRARAREDGRTFRRGDIVGGHPVNPEPEIAPNEEIDAGSEWRQMVDAEPAAAVANLIPDDDDEDDDEDDTKEMRVLELLTSESKRIDLYCVIDGERYYYANVEAWGLKERSKLSSVWSKMDKLESKENPTEGDEIRYHNLVAQFLSIVSPDLPRRVIDALSPGSRQALVLDFLTKAAQHSPVFKALGTKVNT